MTNSVRLLALALGMGFAGSAASNGTVPSVPLSIVSASSDRQPLSDKIEENRKQTGKNQDQSGITNDADEFTVESGRTQIVRVSRGHLNRIVTPFDRPVVDMVDQTSTVQIQDNVVLFATSSDAPVSMYIREHGSQELAINLVVYPQSIPPKELRIKLGQSYQLMQGPMRRPNAERWERSNPYTTTLAQLFTTIAQGDVPQGYRVSNTLTQSSAYIPSCNQHSLVFNFIEGQMIEGHNLTVMVGIVKNVGDSSQEIDEANCDNWNVAGVAAWPNVYLEPGEVSEIYVAVRNNRQAPVKTKRPSLLNPTSNGDE